MMIMVDLPPRLVARMEREAARQGVLPSALLAGLVSRELPEDAEPQGRERSLALLRSVAGIGDKDEQAETFACLWRATEEG